MAGLNMTDFDLVALGNAEFLEFWEHGYRLHPLDRALLTIRTSRPPGATTDEPVADWPLGRRNRALAQVRMLYFGPRLEGWTVCPQCGEKLEFEVDCGGDCRDSFAGDGKSGFGERRRVSPADQSGPGAGGR